MKKKQLILTMTLLLGILCPTCKLSAQGIAIDGLMYDIDVFAKTASVVSWYWGDNIREGAIDIPSSICVEEQQYKVMGIGDGAFMDCMSLKSVTMPETIEVIAGNAFKNCMSLTSITIPNKVKSIEPNTFQGCSGLTSVLFLGPIDFIEDYAFSGCSNLKHISFTDSLTEIETGAFLGCRNLENIVLPESLTIIGPSAFAECENLATMSLPVSLRFIGKDAFRGCDKLTKIMSPLSTSTVDAASIYEYYDSFDFFDSYEVLLCRAINDNYEIEVCGTADGFDGHYLLNLVPLNIQYDHYLYRITSIADKAFANLSLSEIYLPNSISSIGKDAFQGCGMLECIYVPIGSIEYFKNLLSPELCSKLEECDPVRFELDDRTIRYTELSIVEDEWAPMDEIKTQEEELVFVYNQEEYEEFDDRLYLSYSVYQEPTFPGGEDAMFKFIYDNLKYPVQAAREGIEGEVVLSLEINKDGSIEYINVEGVPVDWSLVSEAERVVEMMPNFEPARNKDGQPLRVLYPLSVVFKLDK